MLKVNEVATPAGSVRRSDDQMTVTFSNEVTFQPSKHYMCNTLYVLLIFPEFLTIF